VSDEVGLSLIKEARRRLVHHFPAMVRACLDALSDDDLWWRPNEAANSVGNLVLHMCGSSRHFVGRGVTGGDYVRDRPAEFAERGPIARAELVAVLETTVQETARALDGLDPSRLREVVTTVGDEQTVQYLVSRTSHHWAVHTGQVVYVTKLRKPGALVELWDQTLKP